jgi:predicted outer membrane repeat protein
MSDRNYSVTYGGAIAASTTKTFLTFISGAATVDGDLVQVSVSFNASTAGTGIHVEIVRYTTDGTGTAYTPLK